MLEITAQASAFPELSFTDLKFELVIFYVHVWIKRLCSWGRAVCVRESGVCVSRIVCCEAYLGR